MWIQTDSDSLVKLSTPEVDETVEFSEQGTAQVSQEVGEVLIDQFDSITEKDNE